MSQDYNQYYDGASGMQILEFYLPNDLFKKNFDKAFVNFSEDFVYPGFRKGKVPSNIVLAKNYEDILNKTLVMATEEYIQGIYDDIKPQPLSSFTITSFVKDKDSKSYKITLSYIPIPIVELPDFSTITVVRVKPKQPTEDDIEYEIKNIWYMHASKDNPNFRKDDFDINFLNSDFILSLKLKNGDKNVTSLDELREYVFNSLSQSYQKLAEFETEKLVKNEIIKATKYHYLEGIVIQELNNRKKHYINKNDNEDINLESLEKKWKEEIEFDLKFDLLIQNYSLHYGIKVTDDEIQDELTKLVSDIRYFDFNDSNLKNLVLVYKLRQKVFLDILNKVNLVDDLN